MKYGLRLVCLVFALWTLSPVSANDSLSVSTAPITLYTYEIPGLIQNDNNQAVGLGIETLRLLFEKAGYTVDFELHPFARVKGSVAKYEGACGFPVNYSEQREQRIDYMLPLTLVNTQFYALEDTPLTLEQLQQRYVVSLIQHSATEQLEAMDLKLLFVSNPNTAINLLKAGRADVIVMDDSLIDVAQQTLQQTLYPVRMLSQNATYLVCHKGLRDISQASLEAAFIELLRTGELRERWDAFGAGALFDDFFGVQGERWQALLNAFRVVVVPPTAHHRRSG